MKLKRRTTERKLTGFECLETRTVMASVTAALTNGVLKITGTAGNDEIVVRRVNNTVQVGGITTSFNVANVASILIEGAGGNDRITLDGLNTTAALWNKPISVSEPSGNAAVKATDGGMVYFNGKHVLTTNTNRVLALDGKAPDFFDRNIRDQALRDLLKLDFADQVVNRTEMLDVFKQVAKDGVVSADEFEDLKAIAGNVNLYRNVEYVGALARNVILGNNANRMFQGQVLGNLQGGSSAVHLNKLVGEWFLGADRPSTTTSGMTFSYTVANGQLFGANGPAYTDVTQGYVGDCYYVAALGELALKTPADVRNMFIVNGDGTYTVRFFNNGRAEFVTVDSQLPVTSAGRFVFANMGQLASSASNVLWVALAEKAYVQMNESGWLRTGLPGNGINAYAAIAGGYMSDALKQVTGRNAVNYAINTTDAAFNAVAAAFASGKSIGFATNGTPANSLLVGGHQYALVGINTAAKTITVFNPWGMSSGASKPGLVTISWSALASNFGYFTMSV